MAKKNALRTVAAPKTDTVSEENATPSAEKFFEETQAAESFDDPITFEVLPPPAVPLDLGSAPAVGSLQFDPKALPLGLVVAPDTLPPRLVIGPLWPSEIAAIQKATEEEAAQKAFEEASIPTPTKTSIACVLGRVAITGENVTVGAHKVANNTRWIFDVELDGNTAVELDIKLLGFNTGAAIDASIVSFTLGALNGNFYPARPHIVQEGNKLTLKTIELKRSAIVRFRVSLDTYHSAHR